MPIKIHSETFHGDFTAFGIMQGINSSKGAFVTKVYV